MLVSLTVGKVDAGVTVLLTPDKRLVRSLSSSPNQSQSPPGKPANHSFQTPSRSNSPRSFSRLTSPLDPLSTSKSPVTRAPSRRLSSPSAPFKNRSSKLSAPPSPSHLVYVVAMPPRRVLSSSGTRLSSPRPTSSASPCTATAKRPAPYPNRRCSTRPRLAVWQ